MEADSGGDIEVEVGVMHAVQPPEHRHRMEQDVLQIDRKVEQDHRGRNGQPGRYRKRIQQAPFALFGEQCETDGGERKRQTDQQGVKDNEGHVARPTAQAPDAEIPPRRQHFPRRHRGEPPAKATRRSNGSWDKSRSGIEGCPFASFN